jgi:hypothetical protein
VWTGLNWLRIGCSGDFYEHVSIGRRIFFDKLSNYKLLRMHRRLTGLIEIFPTCLCFFLHIFQFTIHNHPTSRRYYSQESLVNLRTNHEDLGVTQSEVCVGGDNDDASNLAHMGLY